MAAPTVRGKVERMIYHRPEINEDVVFKIVIELKKANGWKRIQWKAVAEHYIRETGKDATPDKAFQKKVRRAFQDYSYDSKKHLHDAYEHYGWWGYTSQLKEVLFVDSVGKLDINVIVTNYGATTLYIASEAGFSEVVSLLLAMQDIDVNQADNNGATPLYVASHRGNSEVVSMLLAKQDIDVNQANNNGATPLYIASENDKFASQEGLTRVVSMLLAKQGIDVNQAKDNGATPLLIASEKGRADVVSMLLAKQGVKVNQATNTGTTPLYIASENGHAEVVSMLLAKQGIDVNQADRVGATPLFIASQNGHSEVVSMLLAKQDVKVNQPLDDGADDGATPLFIASVKGHAEVVKELLAKQDIDVNQAKNNGATPLLIASEEGHAEVVSMLLAKEGIDVNQTMNGGATPLYIASQNDHAEVVSMLLAKQGVDVNQAKDNGTTPLLIASYSGHADVVRLLLAAPGVDVNKADDDDWTPLYIASQKGHSEVVSMLLAMPGIDVNKATPSDKNTPLLVACKNEHLGVVELLLAHADILPNEADRDGKTPLIVACEKDSDAIVHALINNSLVDPNKPNNIRWAPLAIACEKNKVKAVQAMLGSPLVDVNVTQGGGVTPLFVACQNGHTRVVKVLLKEATHAVDINAKRTSDDFTPLLVACERKHADIVKALIKAKADKIKNPLDFSAKSNRRMTALHWAIANPREGSAGGEDVRLAIVKMLLQKYRANVNAKKANGDTALFLACRYDHTQVVKELLKLQNIKVNTRHGMSGFTALVEAVRNKNVEIVKMLMKFPGINPNIRTTDQSSCFGVSLGNYDSEILSTLLAWGGLGFPDAYRGADISRRMAKMNEVEQAYLTGHAVTPGATGGWKLIIQGETFLSNQINARVRPSTFRDAETVPTKTFTLNARDVTMFTDEIDAPVRCVPCMHPHEASSLHRWLNTPMNPNNPNRLHKGCPLCQQEPEWVEFMSKMQVGRWNNMEKASSKYEQELKRLRPLLENSSSSAVYKQFEASKAVRESNEAKAQELEKERRDIEEQIRKLREKRGEVLHAASDVQTVVDRTNVTLATLQSQLDRDPEFKKNVADREAARKAIAKNKLQNRYTPGTKSTLKF